MLTTVTTTTKEISTTTTTTTTTTKTRTMSSSTATSCCCSCSAFFLCQGRSDEGHVAVGQCRSSAVHGRAIELLPSWQQLRALLTPTAPDHGKNKPGIQAMAHKHPAYSQQTLKKAYNFAISPPPRELVAGGIHSQQVCQSIYLGFHALDSEMHHSELSV